jgi:prepilin-type N-terminal cleavage/methylation domain-containing protein
MFERSCRPVTARRSCHEGDLGFSLLELMLTIGIMGLVSAIAIVQIGTAQQAIKSDSGMRVIVAQLNLAREMAIAQRRTMQVQFLVPNALRIDRNDVPAGTTRMASMVLEGSVQYALVAGVPDTPDAFGRNAAVDFGGAPTLVFTSEGMLVDAAGNPINGTVFLSINGGARSVRAITVLGATGRVRAYRWNGAQWTRL